MLKIILKYLALIIIIGIVLLHFVSLDNDPPLFYVGHGQSLLTDPYHLTHAARNEVLFDNWNQYEYFRFDVFKNSIISGLSYFVFESLGVSRITANIASLILHLTGLLLFIMGLFKIRSNKEILITVLFLLLNATLFFYGRLPFLENGLIFLSGLTFFIFMRYHDKIWGQVVTGGLIALTALAGKLFGFILIGPVILIFIFKYRAKFVLPSLITLGGLIVTAFLYIIIFYGNDLSILTNYYTEQTTGMYGAPPGLSSVTLFFKTLITYGGESGMVEFAPFIFLSIIFSLILATFIIPFSGKFNKDHIPIIFCIGWLLAGVAGLMPFYYRPIRYALFLFLPGAMICGCALHYVLSDKIKLSLHNKYLSLPLLFFSLWYLFTQIFIFFAPFGKKFSAGTNIMPLTALLAVAIIAILFFVFFRRQSYTVKRWPAIILGLVLLSIVVNQGKYFYDGLTDSGQLLNRYNIEMIQLIDDNAVLTGPYAPALTIDNNTKSVIYVFGLSNIEKNLFERFPITHIATDFPNWKRAKKDFPFLESSLLVVQSVIRDQVISLYRIPTATITETYFEIGQRYFKYDIFDSALVNFKRFTEQYPENILGQIHLGLAYMSTGEIEKSLQIMTKLLAEYPDDYMLHSFCIGYYKRLHTATGDENYLRLSGHYERLGKKRIPRMAKAG